MSQATARTQIVRPSPRGIPPALGPDDVRKLLDESVGRGWAEIGRRFVRIGILLASDILLSLAAGALALETAGGLLRGGPGAILGWGLVLILMVQPFTLATFGNYGSGRDRLAPGALIGGVACAAGVGLLGAVLLGQGGGVRLFATYFGFAGIAVLAGRVILERVVNRAYRQGIWTRRFLVIGTPEEADDLRSAVRSADARDIEIVGRLSPRPEAEFDALGTLADLSLTLRETGAREVLVASKLSFEALETLCRVCFEAGAAVNLLPKTLHKLDAKLEVRLTRSGSFVQLRPRRLGVPQLALKRVMDLALCALGMVVILPLFGLIAAAIRLDSPGPVFFRQRRAGVGGRPFWMYKFRTMVVDADAMKGRLQHLNESGDPRLFKIRSDPRITRVGQFLRRTSLDELPQLLNVVRGEMSLVGPRPFFPEDLESYEEHHFERLHVLPGITGLWQVSGRSDIPDFDEVVRLDVSYIREWSLLQDIKILLQTLPAALRRGGAY
jgi:exopolysaccharide biosynthesis polyprenyl glycosylphosphotransferase